MTTNNDCAAPGSSVSAMIIVCIVDDDASVRKSLANLLRSAGYRSRVFTSGEEFLALENFDDIACVSAVGFEDERTVGDRGHACADAQRQKISSDLHVGTLG